MKKFLSLALALILVLGVSAVTLADDAKTFDEIVDITYFVAESDMVEYPWSMTDMPALAACNKVANERFGINIVLETCLGTEINTILSARLASGVDLPDIMRWQVTQIRLGELYDQGLILGLNQYEELMPNYMAMLEKLPSVKIYQSGPTGELLSMVQVVMNPQHITKWFTIRMDWLDKVGLAIPTTTEELRAALVAFQESDVNGNGLKDETLAWRDKGALQYLNRAVAPWFGVKDMSTAANSWYTDDAGKVYSTMLTDEAKAYMTYMASLYADGLIWEQSFNDTTEEFNTYKLSESRAGSTGPYWDAVLANTELNGYGLKSEFIPIRPLTDGTHAQAIVKENFEGNTRHLFSKSCKVPERVIPYWDFFFGVEGSQLSYYGESAPGGDYFVKDDTEYEALGLTATPDMMNGTDKYYEELKTEPSLYRKLGANTIFPHCLIGTADIVAGDFYFSFSQEACGRAVDIQMNLDNLNWAMDNGTPALPMVMADTAQASVLSNHADLFTYMEEMYLKFITNVEPIDKWDEFVSTCNSMGMGDVLAVQQARADAFAAQSAN